MFNVLAGISVSDILSIALAAVGFVSFMALVCLTDGFACGDGPQNQDRQTSPRQTSAAPKYNKQSPENMEQMAVKRNGQLKKYQINKYGEIFEE